jgi:hypothetical protein
MDTHDPDNPDLRDEIEQCILVTSSTRYTAEIMELVDRYADQRTESSRS